MLPEPSRVADGVPIISTEPVALKVIALADKDALAAVGNV
jgi:hypothetical protein